VVSIGEDAGMGGGGGGHKESEKDGGAGHDVDRGVLGAR
jgi:hypothetical protein